MGEQAEQEGGPAAKAAAPAGDGNGLSDLLGRMVGEPREDGRLSLEELMTRAGRRGPAFLMLFLCLLSMIFSVVPGFSTLVGLPLLILSAQMALGRRRLGLPGWLGRRSFDQKLLAQGLYRRMALVQRFERLVRPRLKLLCTRPFHRVMGIVGTLCAIVLSLPIPLMNFPPTLAVFLMALGVLTRDGAMVLAGLLLAVLLLGGLVVVAIFIPDALAELWSLLGFGSDTGAG